MVTPKVTSKKNITPIKRTNVKTNDEQPEPKRKNPPRTICKTAKTSPTETTPKGHLAKTATSDKTSVTKLDELEGPLNKIKSTLTKDSHSPLTSVPIKKKLNSSPTPQTTYQNSENTANAKPKASSKSETYSSSKVESTLNPRITAKQLKGKMVASESMVRINSNNQSKVEGTVPINMQTNAYSSEAALNNLLKDNMKPLIKPNITILGKNNADEKAKNIKTVICLE